MNTLHFSALNWRWCTFDALSAHELHRIHRARQAVFVMEQACLYADADVYDEQAHHLSAWSVEQSLPLAYARVLAPGVKYAEPSIGRVLTLATARGQGLGQHLVARALACTAGLYAGQKVRISAQARLVDFYGALGFVTVGEPYLEDGLPHIEMLLKSPLQVGPNPLKTDRLQP